MTRRIDGCLALYEASFVTVTNPDRSPVLRLDLSLIQKDSAVSCRVAELGELEGTVCSRFGSNEASVNNFDVMYDFRHRIQDTG